MKHVKIDSFDKRVLFELSADANSAVSSIAKKLKVTSPTISSRIKRLVESGVLKIVGMLNPSAIANVTMVLIAISISDHIKLDEKLKEISELDCVNWAIAVTGRYDIFAAVVVFNEGMEGIYHFLTDRLSHLKGIAAFETFVVMKEIRNWIFIPEGSQAEKWLVSSD